MRVVIMTNCNTQINILLYIWHPAYAQETAKKCRLGMRRGWLPPSVDKQIASLSRDQTAASELHCPHDTPSDFHNMGGKCKKT